MNIRRERMRKMRREKSNIICALIAAVLALGLFYAYHYVQSVMSGTKEHVKVGFIYDGDASTPYSANFIRAAGRLRTELGKKVDIIEKNNVPYDNADEIIDELVKEGCDIVFTNSYGYGEAAKKAAEKYSDVEFCEATCDNANDEPRLENYHTFMGEIYQGRYICGMAAGAKLNEMIENGVITRQQAVVGFVAAYPVAEVISGYTAFLMGVRSQCPDATMRVKYIDTWGSFSLEKEAAQQLIDEGCVVISHHTNTVGSAIACENADLAYPVYHVSYNQDMIDFAPASALISCRIDWSEYIISAVNAVIENKKIEKAVNGRVNGYDTSGGMKAGWVKILEINSAIAPKGCEKLVQQAQEDMSAGKIHVFKGDYIGVAPDDPSDTYDLNKEYIENENSSAPTFHYVLKDIITVTH